MPDTVPLDLTTWLSAHFAKKWRDHPRELSIKVVAPDHPTTVAVDPPRFAQAIDAVVDNSFKHGSIATLVTVTVARRGGSVVITVDDLGPGIPEADRAGLFAKPGRSLHAVADIIRSFGGKVSALPHQGGARIAIVLPAVAG